MALITSCVHRGNVLDQMEDGHAQLVSGETWGETRTKLNETDSRVTALESAMDDKQDASTASTDAERIAGLALKQDAATAATDSELADGLALKQDAVTASTDAERIAGLSEKLNILDIDDIPVDGETGAPISSNRMYDHENSSDAHPGYVQDTELTAGLADKQDSATASTDSERIAGLATKMNADPGGTSDQVVLGDGTLGTKITGGADPTKAAVAESAESISATGIIGTVDESQIDPDMTTDTELAELNTYDGVVGDGAQGLTATGKMSADHFKGNSGLPSRFWLMAGTPPSDTIDDDGVTHDMVLFIDSSDGHLKSMDSIGTVTDLMSGGTLIAAIPSYDYGTGTYYDDVSVTMSTSTSGGVICYTTDGSDPTATVAGTCDDNTYSAAIDVTATGSVLKAITTADGYENSGVKSGTYTLQVADVSESPGAPYSGPATDVTLSTTTSGAVIHYREDGTAAGCSDTEYTGAISVSSTETITAIGCKADYNNSSAFSGVYTISSNVATPSFDNGTGTYNNDVTVALSTTTSGATICYTLDGSTPTAVTPGTCDDYTYSSALSVTATGSTINAIATMAGMTNSSEAAATYTLQVADITASPTAPYSGSATDVTLSTTTTGASIHYREDGTAASCSDTTYSGAISVSTTETITAIACKSDYVNSSEFSGTYTISSSSDISLLQDDDKILTSNTMSISTDALGSAISTGNTIIGCIWWKTTAEISSITDNLGNTYTIATERGGTANSTTCTVFYAPVTAGGSSLVVTAALTANSEYTYIWVGEFENIASSPLDQVGVGGPGTTSPITFTEITPTVDGSLVVQIVAQTENGQSPINGFTQVDTASYTACGYIIQTTAAAVSSGFSTTSTGVWTTLGASFKPVE